MYSKHYNIHSSLLHYILDDTNNLVALLLKPILIVSLFTHTCSNTTKSIKMVQIVIRVSQL